MNKKINIGSIKLPTQAATKGFAFIGKRGSGKSYGAAVLAEEFARVGVPFVIFDPIDVWWGLRLAADGKKKGLPVVVFGKEHADIQLTRGMGKQIAQSIVRENISCVISTFGMSKTEMREIIADFSETLLNINDTPRHVFIEEAHEYVPQRVMGATARCFASVEALIVMGRNRGIGVSLLNQRMATINKDVVSQIDTLVAFRSVGPQDRKALRDWMEAHEEVYADGEAESDFDKFIKSVPSLPTGEAWVWSPEFMHIFERVQFRKRETFHPDREKLGVSFKMPKMSSTDIEAFVEKFSKKPEKKPVVIPMGDKLSVRDVVDMKQSIAKVQQESYDAGCRVTEAMAQKVCDRIKRESNAEADRLRRTLVKIGQLVAGSDEKVSIQAVKFTALGAVKEHPAALVARHSVAIERSQQFGGSVEDHLEPYVTEKPVQGGAMRMLKVLVSRYPMEFSRPQLGTLADVKHSGGSFGTYLSLLKVKNLIDERSGKIVATDLGIEFLGDEKPEPQTPEQVRDMWRGKLQGGARRMFDVLEQSYPDGFSRRELGELANVSVDGGSFGTYLSQLKSNGLAEEQDRIITLSKTLYV